MPSKRSINLVQADENRISVWKAVPAILLIIALAALFSKYMVADRLIAVSRAQSATEQVRQNLGKALEKIDEFGPLEETYAHYTYADMTQAELDQVDRTEVLRLVGEILPAGEATKLWSVSGNVLTVEMSGSSLETLNQLAHQMEQDPIVDSCSITTANKNLLQQQLPEEDVWARFIVYLHQPAAEEATEP